MISKKTITYLILCFCIAMLIFGCEKQIDKNKKIDSDITDSNIEKDNCGDSTCSIRESQSGSCPSDCKAERDYESKLGEQTANENDKSCVKEGETIPLIPNAPKCCEGLSMIERKESSVLGIAGICTAKCGNGNCDSETESVKNCPADCKEVLDTKPVCEGIGTSKEGWYQNDKILVYSFCKGCEAECKNKGTASEGWYSSCTEKQIKRMCN